VTLPEDDPGEPPVESPATFDVTLKEIKTRRLPELDDEFAKGFGEFSSLEEMRESVRNTLAERARAQSREAAANEALRQLRETARVDLPEMLVARREESLRETWDRRVAESGRSREEWLAEAGQSEEEWAEALRRQAELDVKTELVLSALAKAEGIVPSEEDVRQEVERIAQSYGRENAARVRRLILNDPDEMADVRERLRYRSAIDLLARIASGEADEAAGTSDSAPADGEADE
ncbi:MAG: hypothetical protein IRY92_00405, partial [Dactylosporangium sp.]|nr:hypothetical protein [Dactylosporangium sp.]